MQTFAHLLAQVYLHAYLLQYRGIRPHQCLVYGFQCLKGSGKRKQVAGRHTSGAYTGDDALHVAYVLKLFAHHVACLQVAEEVIHHVQTAVYGLRVL